MIDSFIYLSRLLPTSQEILTEISKLCGSTPEGALNSMLQFIFQQSTADTRWLRRRMATELAELLAKTSSGKIFESLTVSNQNGMAITLFEQNGVTDFN